jgi:uncharacterized membrane protein YsdA (DUF1294 family)
MLRTINQSWYNRQRMALIHCYLSLLFLLLRMHMSRSQPKKPASKRGPRRAYRTNRRHISPFRLFGGIALIATIGLFWWLGSTAVLPWYASWPLVMSVVTFLLYVFDKMQAVRGGLRVPELVMYVLSLLGGFAGGFAAMLLVRHKTQHVMFWVAQWVGLGLYIGVLWWLMSSQP